MVPDVAGMTFEEAARTLGRAELELRVEARRPHDAIDEGRVFYQEPLAGQSTRRGRQVAIVLSTGPGRIEVPDLAGQSPRAAVHSLRSLGLELGDVVRVHEPRVPSGDIFAQDPPPGSPAREGTQVHVLASLGAWPRTFVMPDLRGRPLPRVEALLASVGIRVAEVRQQVVPGQPAGLVHAQQPPAGAPVRSDAAVSLVVTHQVEQPVRELRTRPRLFTE
jgi:serine/threonine-protein kinase